MTVDERPERGTAEDRVRAGLAALGTPPMPPDVAARLGTALAEARRESRTIAAVGKVPAPARSRTGFLDERVNGRRYTRVRRAVPAGLVAACVAAIAAAAVLASVPSGPEPANDESDLWSAGAQALGALDVGPLGEPARRRACLAAVGAGDPDATLLGGRPQTVRGTPGTLLVLGTEVRGRFRLVVVTPDCGPRGGRLLATTTIG